MVLPCISLFKKSPNVRNLVCNWILLIAGRHHRSKMILVSSESTLQVLCNSVQHITVLPIPQSHILIWNWSTSYCGHFSRQPNTFNYLLKYLRIHQIIHQRAHNKATNFWDFMFSTSQSVIAQISVFIL